VSTHGFGCQKGHPANPSKADKNIGPTERSEMYYYNILLVAFIFFYKEDRNLRMAANNMKFPR